MSSSRSAALAAATTAGAPGLSTRRSSASAAAREAAAATLEEVSGVERTLGKRQRGGIGDPRVDVAQAGDGETRAQGGHDRLRSIERVDVRGVARQQQRQRAEPGFDVEHARARRRRHQRQRRGGDVVEERRVHRSALLEEGAPHDAEDAQRDVALAAAEGRIFGIEVALEVAGELRLVVGERRAA